jgi:hypothetical protein
MNKFEQLIEFVINDEEQKARDLFHEIVVEKSRAIYEDLMAEEEIEEAKDEELDEAKDKDEEELDEAKDEMEESDSLEEDSDDAMGRMDQYDETMGGDQADQLIDEIEVEEEGLSMEGEGEEEEAADDLEDRVVDLEDKLDELMAEFEALMGDEGADGDMEVDMDAEVGGGDEIEMDSETEADMDVEDETMEGAELEEAINLKAAPAPVKSEEGNINKKSTVAANSGARGMDGKPVMSTGADEKGRSAPTAKDMISDVQNAPAKSTVKQGPATKPHLAQATGVNTKSPY